MRRTGELVRGGQQDDGGETPVTIGLRCVYQDSSANVSRVEGRQKADDG